MWHAFLETRQPAYGWGLVPGDFRMPDGPHERMRKHHRIENHDASAH